MHKGLYQSEQSQPFPLSRTKLELFVQCPYCFYLDRKLGIGRPRWPAFTLNSAVDALLKKECDVYRVRQLPHLIAKEYQLDAVPYLPDPSTLLDIWRNNFKGIRFLHTLTNFDVFGAIDDVWLHAASGELIIIDYKSTSKQGEIVLNQPYHEVYKRQLDIYAWLFQKNSYPVHNKAYWLYCNGIRESESFGATLKFKMTLIEHCLRPEWIEKALLQAYECLNAPEPPLRSPECEYCKYLTDVEQVASGSL